MAGTGANAAVQGDEGDEAGWWPLGWVSLRRLLRDDSEGMKRTTITTLHTETDQIFTAFATRWIPACWPGA